VATARWGKERSADQRSERRKKIEIGAAGEAATRNIAKVKKEKGSDEGPHASGKGKALRAAAVRERDKACITRVGFEWEKREEGKRGGPRAKACCSWGKERREKAMFKSAATPPMAGSHPARTNRREREKRNPGNSVSPEKEKKEASP